MTRLRTLLITVTAFAALAAWPTSVLAIGPTGRLLRECQRDTITGTYTQREYLNALKSIPTDGEEYTACRNVIRRAQLAAFGPKRPTSSGSGAPAGAGGSSGGGAGLAGSSGTRPSSVGGTAQQLLDAATPSERRAIGNATTEGGDAPVSVGGRRLSPTPTGLAPGGAANTLPVPLLVALVLLGFGLLAALARAARTRTFPAIRGVRARVDARRGRTA